MPEELSDAQEAALHQELQTLEAELIRSLKSLEFSSNTVDLDQPIGRLTRIDALQAQKMSEAEKSRLELRLRTARVALQTYASGDYGYCKKCGEPIGYGRLKARPETPCCVVCMALIEAR